MAARSRAARIHTGNALRELGSLAEAIDAYRRAIRLDGMNALAHLGLGRAYALAGDNAKAKTAYQDFFALWKNADPDIPILQQAKAEYAKLK